MVDGTPTYTVAVEMEEGAEFEVLLTTEFGHALRTAQSLAQLGLPIYLYKDGKGVKSWAAQKAA